MSRDPYIDVKRYDLLPDHANPSEVEQNLATTQSLLASYDRIASSAGPSSSSPSPALLEAQEELRNTLNLLEADLEDLEESVRVVEQTGDRWGIAAKEVKGRRAFVERVKGEVRGLKARISRKPPNGAKGKERARYSDNPDEAERGEDDVEEAKRWEKEEQQMLVQRQDDTLGVISGTLHTLASQAGLIGHEVGEQTEMLEDLTGRVDSTESRLRKVSRTMQDFIRRNEETKSGWCICILIFVLIALLVAVIIT